MWITHEQLCDLADAIQDSYEATPWYKFVLRHALANQLAVLVLLIDRMEQLARDEMRRSYRSDGGHLTN